VGRFAPAASTACARCEPGLADTDSNPATECEPCRVGTHAPALATSCAQCPLGHVDQDRDPATPCFACAPGSFADVSQGKHSCEACTPGMYNLRHISMVAAEILDRLRITYVLESWYP
jgi:hypothetical protein